MSTSESIDISSDVVSFGEIMLRLSPTKSYQPLVNTNELSMAFAGAESTLAINLAFWGTKSKFVTVLPDNVIGQSALNNIREYGVNAQDISFQPGRMGTYFIEYGTSVRASKILYDRQYSAIAVANSSEFDWQHIFKGAQIFFTTGITPALSDSCAEIGLQALKVAKERGMTTCFDLNYRRTLWHANKAKEVLNQYLPFIDVLIGNEGAAKDIFGIKLSETDTKARNIELIARLKALVPNVKMISVTDRKQLSASRNRWCGYLQVDDKIYSSQSLDIDLIERLGAGDAFAAGLLHGINKRWLPQEILEYAVAASAIKHTVPGDLCLVSEADILALAKGDTAGYIKR